MKNEGFVFGVLLYFMLSFGTVSALDFIDLSNHWSKRDVLMLVQKGAIKGYEDGSFKPNNNITRAEFIKIIVSCIDAKVEMPEPSAESHWADSYIKAALKKEIILEGEFADFNRSITRGEISMMIVRSMGNNNKENYDIYKNLISDWALIDNDEMKGYIIAAFSEGIITGYPDGSFGCDETATRAEASTMIIRLLEEDKRVKYSKLKGIWTLNKKTSLSTEMRISIGESSITHYSLLSQGKSIGDKVPWGNSICSIPVMFSDPEKLSIIFYSNDKIVGSAVIKNDGTINAVIKEIN